jgi:hypothetical protein
MLPGKPTILAKERAPPKLVHIPKALSSGVVHFSIDFNLAVDPLSHDKLRRRRPKKGNHLSEVHMRIILAVLTGRSSKKTGIL